MPAAIQKATGCSPNISMSFLAKQHGGARQSPPGSDHTADNDNTERDFHDRNQPRQAHDAPRTPWKHGREYTRARHYRHAMRFGLRTKKDLPDPDARAKRA